MNDKITLSGAEIAECSESLTAELTEKYRCEPKEAKRIALTAEEILLTIRDKYGEEKPAEMVLKKLLPTMIIFITTNSSSAAFLNNTETCRKKLGIADSIVNFGVPFGQVICKSGIAAIMSCVCFCLASYYNVNMTPAWFITATLGTVMISIAVLPIPGGGLAAYTVLFGLLGIPSEGLAVAIPIEMIMEYPATAVDLSTVQLILIRTADKLKKLDSAVLRSKE